MSIEDKVFWVNCSILVEALGKDDAVEHVKDMAERYFLDFIPDTVTEGDNS